MSTSRQPGIYLITEFDWPDPVDKEHAAKARKLHDVVQNRSWIREVAAGTGGLRDGLESIWIFWLENYTALDRLFRDQQDEVSQAYAAFFALVPGASQKVRDETVSCRVAA